MLGSTTLSGLDAIILLFPLSDQLHGTFRTLALLSLERAHDGARCQPCYFKGIGGEDPRL